MFKIRLISALTVLGVMGCTGSTVAGCDVTTHGGAFDHDIFHDVVIPSECPVPLANPGSERKMVGAYVVEQHVDEPPEFTDAVVNVRNVDGEYQFGRFHSFREVDDFTSEVYVEVEYIAATANSLVTDKDYGIIEGWHGRNQTLVAFAEIEITYTPSDIEAEVGGPDLPLSNTSQTWSVSADGGVPAYSYDWFRDSVYVGSGSSITLSTGTRGFTLHSEVTDQAWAQKTAVYPVDVDGVRAAISGPTEVYASQGGDTWTVSARGGYTPYAFTWFVDDVQVGTGTSWTGYPGDGVHHLLVEMEDSNSGRSTSGLSVLGIGSSSCDPEPPEFKCE